MAPDLVGTWRAEHEIGPDGRPRPLEPAEIDELSFRPDGSAHWRFLQPRTFPGIPDGGPGPSGETWEVRQPGTVSVWIPIAPMPEYGMPEWTREERRYAVLAVTADTLTLSRRPYDGESVVLYRRVGEPA